MPSQYLASIFLALFECQNLCSFLWLFCLPYSFGFITSIKWVARWMRIISLRKAGNLSIWRTTGILLTPIGTPYPITRRLPTIYMVLLQQEMSLVLTHMQSLSIMPTKVSQYLPTTLRIAAYSLSSYPR